MTPMRRNMVFVNHEQEQSNNRLCSDSEQRMFCVPDTTFSSTEATSWWLERDWVVGMLVVKADMYKSRDAVWWAPRSAYCCLAQLIRESRHCAGVVGSDAYREVISIPRQTVYNAIYVYIELIVSSSARLQGCERHGKFIIEMNDGRWDNEKQSLAICYSKQLRNTTHHVSACV